MSPLADLARRLAAADVRRTLDRMRGLRVLVVGETILDEYVFCNPMGKSGKEPLIVTRHERAELQGGGALAVANHVAEVAGKVELVSAIGTAPSREETVRAALKPSVEPCLVRQPGAPTILKRRFVDSYSLAKLFAIYEMSDAPLGAAEDAALCRALEERLPACDAVIVADYGHGLISPRAVALLAARARFLAVNTQLNAANAGFHTISRYPRADYACLHEGELRLDARDRSSPVEALAGALAERLGAPSVMVTRGRHGTLLRHGGRFHACPALADRVVERVGAGDAVLGVTAVALAAGASPDAVGLLGNLAGAQAVSVVGNRASIRREALLASADALLPARLLRAA